VYSLILLIVLNYSVRIFLVSSIQENKVKTAAIK